MENELRANLLLLADAYVKATGISLATLARQAAGDWRFFRNFDDDKTFTARKYDEVVQWFSDNWPDGAKWPKPLSRPARNAELADRGAA